MEMPTVQCDSKSPEAAVLPPAGMCLFGMLGSSVRSGEK